MNIIEIVRQGAPIIQSATLLYKSEDVMIVCLDMVSKYCEVTATGDNVAYLGASDSGLYLHGCDRNEMTEVRVDPAYSHFIGSRAGRYDINLVFAKEGFYKQEFPGQILALPKEDKLKHHTNTQPLFMHGRTDVRFSITNQMVTSGGMRRRQAGMSTCNTASNQTRCR